MKYQNNKKHPVAFLIAALLACQPITAQAVTFADINQVPWPGAEVSINKAADLGLVVGETRNGKSYFKPKDPVSLAESCQFAYKVMVQTGKATADVSVTQKWASVMNVYKIQSWAHTAVAYCLENNIVSISDLSGFVSGETNRSATREQAAEILGRALEVGVPSLRATATATTFVDNASISADARPYIALLNSQKIVNGDDLNKFNPKNTLNRTETAVMVTNLYEKLKNTSAVVTPVLTSKEGKIADITNFYVNLDGSTSYYLYSSSGISATLNEKTSTISELINLFKSGSTIEVKLTFDSNNRVTKIEASSGDVEEAKATEGVLTKVKYDEEENDGRIVLDEKYTYIVDDADYISVEIDDDDYDFDELYDLFSELKKGDKITVKLTLDSKGELKKIVGTLKDADDEVKGTVTDLDSESDDSGVIKVDKKGYDIEDVTDIDIELDNDDVTFEELMEEFDDMYSDELMKVVLTLEDGYVIKIDASIEEESDSGEAEGIIDSADYEYDEIVVDGDSYDVDTSVDVEIIDGDDKITSWEDLSDAVETDKKKISVELTLDSDDVVTDITGYVTEAKGRLSSFKYDEERDDYYLKIKISGTSHTYLYDVDDYDKVDVSISSMSLSDYNDNNDKDLEDLISWLRSYEEDNDLHLNSSDNFQLKLTLDKDGYITKVSGSYE